MYIHTFSQAGSASRSQRLCSLNGRTFVAAAFVAAALVVAVFVDGGKTICGRFWGVSAFGAVGGGANNSGCFSFNSSNLIPDSDPRELYGSERATSSKRVRANSGLPCPS